jgi:hypothetical protein
MRRARRLASLLLVLSAAVPARGGDGAKVDFNRDVRPILSNHCYACHGPDRGKRKAGLRLDRKADASKALRGGASVVVPGSLVKSTLWRRVGSADETERMPPAHFGKPLSVGQRSILRSWIEQGAAWREHWAYLSPKRPAQPAVRERTWPRNGLDHFILARLERQGLAPSPEADRATLIRRVTLDLTGLPPSPAEVDAFVVDKSPNAYDKVVNRLLGSPHFGERWAQHWLDLARYADTNGYHIDNHRDMWKWREWVVGAFNANLPFDRFTVEQLAGDLLPNPTLGQKIASGFNRNTMVNFEGGADPDEYHTKYVIDRVTTTATVWLGTTIGCAECHDHKYDPFTQREFYRLYAFFNNVPERGLDGQKDNPVPSIRVPTRSYRERKAALRKQRLALDERLRRAVSKAMPDCDVDDLPAGVLAALDKEEKQLQRAEAALESGLPSVMVMEEMPRPRDTFVLVRGNFQHKGEKVTPGVPGVLARLPRGMKADRLALAKWLVRPDHPLTARVTVNRYWEQLFGTGLVKTGEDFGSQGDWPSHPELLDWLATEFVANGWDVKAFLKTLVTSATYRQSSRVMRLHLAKDPENRLLARGARFRLPAEAVRDNALAVSGLLNRKLGGPSVRPYQPPGLWEQLAFGGAFSSQTYVQSSGPDLYRRGLYTYWKRSLPHPTLVTFDAPNREVCTDRRPRTNTPLQALVLLNDPIYVECARVLGQRVLRESGADTSARLTYAFKLCTARPPRPAELPILRALYEKQRLRYGRDRAAALRLVGVGESPRPADLDVAELAAWTAVGNVLLNLDETITKG